MSSKVEMVPEHGTEGSNISADYLSRLQGFEDQNKRILRMIQFMIRAGATNERFLQGLDHDFSAQTSQISDIQEAFTKFQRDTREWAQFVNTTMDFTQTHFTQQLAVHAQEIQEIKDVMERNNKDLRELIRDERNESSC